MRCDVLDHGYVEFVEAWGTGKAGVASTGAAKEPHDYEVGIVEAARQSTQGSFRSWEQDQKLLKYLYEHKHATPFEFAGMVVEVQAPIFVFREWHRHRTQSYNEMSARYAALPDLYYEPTPEHIEKRAKHAAETRNKQAGGQRAIESPPGYGTCLAFSNQVERLYRDAERIYQQALHDGVPKELARLVMPVGHYSRMRCSASLRNWLAFMTLRCDPAAQWEIRQYAGAVSMFVANTFPITHQLWRTENACLFERPAT